MAGFNVITEGIVASNMDFKVRNEWLQTHSEGIHTD
jgi:hypothetical protein